FIVRWNERLIANPTVQRQTGSRLPGILNVKPDVILPVILRRELSLMPGRGSAQHQIRQGQTCSSSIECHLAGSKSAGAIIHQRMNVVCSESKLMSSLGHTQILGELETLRIGFTWGRHLTGAE